MGLWGPLKLELKLEMKLTLTLGWRGWAPLLAPPPQLRLQLRQPAATLTRPQF